LSDTGRQARLHQESGYLPITKAAYEKSIADARGRAQNHAKEARDRVAQASDKQRAELEASLAAKMAETEKRIAAMKSAATASIGAIAADTAGPLVRKLIGVDPTADEVRSALQPAAGE
ncbi:MAG TPA: F0F1 ATP synthase subunit B', partial [Hyphomicrobiaceae bacterium]|nr:F0F1 ATP synthase subunit B' [Hyphomicrobiaceae bacterium]